MSEGKGGKGGGEDPQPNIQTRLEGEFGSASVLERVRIVRERGREGGRKAGG